jgi:hypothetical protein
MSTHQPVSLPKKILFVCQNSDISGEAATLLTEIQRNIQEQVQIVTFTELAAKEKIETSSVDMIHSFAPILHEQETLFEYVRILKPGGVAILYEPLAHRTFDMSENLKTRLTLAGLVQPKITSLGNWIQITTEKPNWELGTAQKISLKKQKTQINSHFANDNSSSSQNVKWSWDMGDENDLIDEDTLLDESDLVKPTKKDDCELSSGKRKACKNCTCGRAEQEALASGHGASKRKLTIQMLENPGVESSCGSCGLGDAFRCAGCPYRGLPPFKPGEKITLPPNFMIDDL